MIEVTSSGDFSATEAWLKKLSDNSIFDSLSKFGADGVAALTAATPKEEGTTAASWYFEIVEDKTSWSIIWGNSNVEDGQIIAVLLQHGHGTRTGGYVEGRDYINPALKPIFDRILAEAEKVVNSA